MKISSIFSITFAFILFLLSLGAVSCRSGRNAVPDSSQSDILKGGFSVRDAESALSARIAGYGMWRNVKLPVTVRLTEPRSLSISGTAVMERDKSLSISLRFLGLEIGSLCVKDDSITVIDRFNKAYFKADVVSLLDGFPATTGNLQDLLTGHVFVPGKNKVKASDFGIAITDDPSLWTASGEVRDFDVKYSFAFREPAVLKALAVSVAGASPVSIAYGDVFSSSGGDFASTVSVEAPAGKTPVKATVEWNFRKAQWNVKEGLADKSVVPSGYSRISPEAVMKMLKNL